VVACGHCGHRHCGTGEDVLPHLLEVNDPLQSAGAVRGEDYDRGRFKLRQLCCAECGALVDVQVAMTGAPRPTLSIEFK
jgi:hypothetical protein